MRDPGHTTCGSREHDYAIAREPHVVQFQNFKKENSLKKLKKESAGPVKVRGPWHMPHLPCGWLTDPAAETGYSNFDPGRRQNRRAPIEQHERTY